MNIRNSLKFIEGKSLIQIRMNLYTIDLIFENEIIVTIANKIKYLDRENKICEWSSVSNSFFSINVLLGKQVSKAIIDKFDNLMLEFENNEFLIIESAKDGNESYIIHYENDFQIIY